MFARVRLRLTLLSVILFVCLYGLSATAVFSIVHRQVIRTVDSRLLNTANHVERNPLAAVAMDATNALAVVASPVGVTTNVTPQVLQQLERLIPPNTTGDMQFVTWHVPGGSVFRIVYVPPWQLPDAVQPLSLYIGTDIANQLSVLGPLLQVLILVGAGGTAVAAIGGFYLAERALRPIRAAWQRQIEFVSDASHELRTPIAVIQSNLGLVLDHPEQTVEANLEWVNNAHGESRRMARLVENLLTLARTDSGAAPIRTSAVEIDALVRHVNDLIEPLAASQGLTLSMRAQSRMVVQGDADRLQQLLIILLDNACKYTDAGGRVTLQADAQKGQVVLRVHDTGRGIAPPDLPHVYERFYRADAARSRDESSGVGLGLSIAQWIVQAHRGRIQIASDPGRGTQVTVLLPATLLPATALQGE